jgi:hypothetical protein
MNFPTARFENGVKGLMFPNFKYSQMSPKHQKILRNIEKSFENSTISSNLTNILEKLAKYYQIS